MPVLLWFFYPLFILPQVGVWLSFGYVLVKLQHGLFWAMLLHSFINAIGFLLCQISSL